MIFEDAQHLHGTASSGLLSQIVQVLRRSLFRLPHRAELTIGNPRKRPYQLHYVTASGCYLKDLVWSDLCVRCHFTKIPLRKPPKLELDKNREGEGGKK